MNTTSKNILICYDLCCIGVMIIMKNKILAIIIEDLPWMYYGRYKQYLSDLNHPFKERIDFFIDNEMAISEDTIKQYPAVIFYYRDPLKHLYPVVYKYAKKIEKICADNGIRFINTPDSLSLSSKSEQLKMLCDSGYLVSRSFKFTDINELKNIAQQYYPMFIRNDAGHDSDNLSSEGPFNNFEDILKNCINKSLENCAHLDNKVALQWIDTKSPQDGLFRRYRVFATKTNAITGNIFISKDWFVHCENSFVNEMSKLENENYKKRDLTKKEEDFFVKINNILGLDFSAIDYSYTTNGEIVVWEANPHPALSSWVDQGELSKEKIVKQLSDFYEQILDENT